VVWLDAAIQREIDRLRCRYELSLDEFRGLYVSDEQVDRLAATRDLGTVLEPPAIPEADFATPLGELRAEFHLTPTEIATVFVAFAPELDRKYETLFAYLNDDVTRRWATVDICRRLTGANTGELDRDTTLFNELLHVVLPRPAAPWRSVGLALRHPATQFLLGSGGVDVPRAPGPLNSTLRRVAVALRKGDLTCVALTGAPLDEARSTTQALAAVARRGLLDVRLDEGIERSRDALLAARLRGAIAYVPLRVTESSEPSIRVFVRSAAEMPTPTVFGMSGSHDGVLEGIDHEVLVLRSPDASSRARIWRQALLQRGIRAPDGAVDDVARLFALYPEQIRRAAARAGRVDGSGRADLQTLVTGARLERSTALNALAQRVPLVHEWSDLVLPGPTMCRLREFASAIRCREMVFREWSFLREAGTTSLRALFSGASGTGKTLAASVVARDLGLDLFRIDLSAVVSKYIGETEKNLERIFSAAEGSNAILLFDEADALFGKRSEVKDAHDRYANIEVAYLLQRMETHDGVMILASNLSKHLDEAFSRRINVDIEFPVPDEEQRERLWRLLLPTAAPTKGDLDIRFLATRFPLTGGEIRNVALSAAFLAAYEGGGISMNHVVRALARQRRKQGKLPSASEFGDYLVTVHGEGI
jgi:hypothetical protein